MQVALASTEMCTWGRDRVELDLLALCVGSRGAVPHYLFICFTPNMEAGKKTNWKHEGIKLSEADLGNSLQLRNEWHVIKRITLPPLRLNASGVFSVWFCIDSPWTLFAHFTCLVKSTKFSRFAPTFRIVSVSARPYNFLIWESNMKKTLLSLSLCSEQFEKVEYWFFFHRRSNR